jgi:hypothetical protein
MKQAIALITMIAATAEHVNRDGNAVTAVLVATLASIVITSAINLINIKQGKNHD